MTNLLNETKEAIERSNHKPTDIIFIGSEISGHSCSWEEFTSLANHTYDSGFGAQEVANDLIIVFNDGSRLHRREYDGAENWDYHRPFKMPKNTKPIKQLITSNIGWENLAEMNSPQVKGNS